MARAPGKVLICGEYAVLEGAPAVVMAVDSYARVTLQPTDVEGVVSLHAPDIQLDSARTLPRTVWSTSQPVWDALSDEQQQRLPLVNEVLAHLGTETLLENGLHMQLSTPDFFDPLGQGKLGLGSSAALTVALMGALQHFYRLPSVGVQETIIRHRAQQNGRGSGVDIAASRQGGLLAYQLVNERPNVQPLIWPNNLVWRAIWVGKPASTGDFLARLAQWQTQFPQRYQAIMAELTHSSHTIISVLSAAQGHLTSSQQTELLSLLQHYGQQLDALGLASGLDIVTQEHRMLMQLAEKYRVVYKTSGAGGGDIGLVFAREHAQLAPFLLAAQAQGFYVLTLEQDSTGLVIEEQSTGAQHAPS